VRWRKLHEELCEDICMRTVTQPSVNPSKSDECDGWTQSLLRSDIGACLLDFAELPWRHEYRNIRVIGSGLQYQPHTVHRFVECFPVSIPLPYIRSRCLSSLFLLSLSPPSLSLSLSLFSLYLCVSHKTCTFGCVDVNRN
jgi:hypothetical protein